MPLIFIFVAVLFWVTVATIMFIGWAIKMLFHAFSAPVYGARGLIYRAQGGARH